MKKNRTASLRQEAYSSRCLQQGNVIDRLREHWGALYQMEAALRDQDANALQAAAEALDAELIRYALSALQTHLNEASIRDCSCLIAESILDTAANQPSLKRWEAWLKEAPFWPELAKDNWREATLQAFEIVLAALGAAGITLTDEVQQALYREVYALQLTELIPETLAAEIFPEESDAEVCDA